jgi:hypothetical protein
MSEPLPTGVNGRTARGTFSVGNKVAKGNPNNRRAQKIRNAIIRAISPKDMAEAAKQLLADAKAGDRQAFAELCDRIIGKPVQSDVLDRIEQLEGMMQELANLTKVNKG